MLRIGYVSLFPEMIQQTLEHSIMGRAQKSGAFTPSFANPRDFATDNHRTVDDSSYGGGPGMVMMAPLVLEAARSILTEGAIVISCDPAGERFTQETAEELSKASQVVFLCGHYEGMDERAAKILNARPMTIGDFVVTGGEVPALLMTDAIVRLLPDVLGDPESHADDSHSSDGLLGFPLYTKPKEIEGCEVPDVLLSGNHKEIAKWRRTQQLKRTRQNRPDLFAKARLKPGDLDLLASDDSK